MYLIKYEVQRYCKLQSSVSLDTEHDVIKALHLVIVVVCDIITDKSFQASYDYVKMCTGLL